MGVFLISATQPGFIPPQSYPTLLWNRDDNFSCCANLIIVHFTVCQFNSSVPNQRLMFVCWLPSVLIWNTFTDQVSVNFEISFNSGQFEGKFSLNYNLITHNYENIYLSFFFFVAHYSLCTVFICSLFVTTSMQKLSLAPFLLPK